MARWRCRPGTAAALAALLGWTAVSGAAPPSSEPLPSFGQAPFIHPAIVADLSAWISDEGDQVVAIDLDGAHGADRYYADEVTLSGDPASPWVSYVEPGRCDSAPCPPRYAPWFGYRRVGTLAGGIEVLFTEYNGGGTGRFRNLLLVAIEHDAGLSIDREAGLLRPDRTRRILRKLVGIPLGDRYAGEIAVRDGQLYIGRDTYAPSAELFVRDTVLSVVGAPAVACAADEQPLFHCVSGERAVSLCADRGRDAVRYRSVAPGHASASVLPMDRVRLRLIPYAGGGEARIRFIDGAAEYVAFDRTVRTGFDPGGHNDPEFSAGAIVADVDGGTAMMECENDASILRAAYDLLERDPSADPP